MSLDLHTGRPYWAPPITPGLRTEALRRDAVCDAAVIGAGITGALVADALTRSGLSVTILDAGEPAMGSTVASTALLQYDLDVPLTRLIAGMGIEDGHRAFRIGIEALAMLHQRSAELGVPFDRLPSLYLATSAARTQALRQEFDARHTAGIAVDWVPRAELAEAYGLHAHAAIASYSSATTNPYALTIALLRTAQLGGARLYSPARVVGIEADGDERILRTQDAAGARGPDVAARWAVWATGYESAVHLPAGMVNLDSTYAIAASAPAGGTALLRRCLWWEFAEPYLYSRWDGPNLLVGGEDEPFSDAESRDRLLHAKAATLIDKYARLAPGIPLSMTHSWAGAFATTPDGLGYIGPTAQDPRVMYALGFGGNGITMSAMAARIIADLIAGRPNSDQALYRLDRPRLEAVANPATNRHEGPEDGAARLNGVAARIPAPAPPPAAAASPLATDPPR